MAVFERHTVVPHPRSTVFDWFTRPGALVRLNPPFGGSIRQEPSDGIRPGSTAVLGIGAPGSLGLGLGSATGFIAGQLPVHLPAWAAPELPWRARHTELIPGERFQDVMDSGPLSRWVHTHEFADRPGSPGSTVMTDRVEYALPAQRLTERLPGPVGRWTEQSMRDELDRIFAYRERQLLGDLHFHATHPGPAAGGPSLTVAVAGSHGLIGTQLCALLTGGGHRVIRLVRGTAGSSPGTRESEGAIVWDPAAGRLDAGDLAGVDVVVNLAGESLGKRLTRRRRDEILRSRESGTRLLAEALAALAGDGRQRALVNASAVGYYGHDAGPGPSADGSGAAGLDEDAPPGTDFLARVCREWEDATGAAEAAGVRTVRVRTGIVQSPAGGMLQQLLPLFILAAGGPVGRRGGRDPWQSWIGVDDIAGIFAHAVLTPDLEGPVNGVAPESVRASEYARVLGRVLHRPAAIPVPGAAPRLLLGAEGAELMVEASQRASAARLQEAGYEFRTPRLEAALRHVLGR